MTSAKYASGRFVLGPRTRFWVAAGVVAHTLWTSAAPSMIYPLYAAEWHLSHAITTAIFAVYPIVVVATLVGCGDLSDRLGHRPVMLAGLAASLTGALVLAVAPSVGWLFAGRIAMGVGVGLTAGPSTAAMVEFAPAGGTRRASSVTAAAQATGLALALLLGGALVQYGPWPTRLSFWVLAAVLAMLLAGTSALPSSRAAETRPGWRPNLPSIPREARGSFLIAALAAMSAYTHGVIILSLGAEVARALVGSSNSLVNGAVLAAFPLALGTISLLGTPAAWRAAVTLGAGTSVAGMAMLEAAVSRHSLALFLLAAMLSGGGYALLFRGGLDLLNRSMPVGQRGGVLSALYLAAYLCMGLVALALGQAANLLGLRPAIDLAAASIAALSVSTFLAAILVPRRQLQSASPQVAGV